ncbi:LacI family DNA-binding transcriptional regulator [Pelagicoccus mobilis]|uniref:LacI family DNA-binding transcriptional regulator n=1 Tax=Pelagicoccus mobilis TaxID=415221 RepID=A0A934VQV6_9BACT|nr:LacI family DNA-binding transcriptional regulator [Pelagicoccus mobilis]MBK1878737.1 LacI family DNA-binding transcriptional regulator [Pelagicoccus mobilis]
MVSTNERLIGGPSLLKGRVTISDVAQQAGVSKATVSMALRGLPEISEKTRERVGELAKEMGYRADPSLSKIAASRWRNRKAQQGSTLAMIEILSDGEDAVAEGEMSVNAKSQAESLGYGFEFFAVKSGKQLSTLARSLFHRGIDGVLFSMRGSELADELFPVEKFACVTIGCSGIIEGIDNVDTDARSEIVTSFKRLTESGASRIGLVLSGANEDLENDFVRRGLFEGLMKKHSPSETPAPVLNFAASDRDDLAAWVAENQLEAVIAYDDRLYDELSDCDVDFVSLATDGRNGEICGISRSDERIGVLGIERLDHLVRLGIRGRRAESTRFHVSGTWIEGRSFRV